MEKIEYRYRFWYRYRPKFMVSDWYRIETKKPVSPITSWWPTPAIIDEL
jgi:hypothetical protein